MTEPTLEQLIAEARDDLGDVPWKLHVKDPEGKAGGKRYTAAMARYLKDPPLWIQVLRRRKFDRKHEQHRREIRPGIYRTTVRCGCKPRYAYLLALWVVVFRESSGLTRIGTRVLESELRVIRRQVDVQRTLLGKE